MSKISQYYHARVPRFKGPADRLVIRSPIAGGAIFIHGPIKDASALGKWYAGGGPLIDKRIYPFYSEEIVTESMKW